ncbi:MAG: Flp pilus assembly protein CpaB [Phycisphaerae bacterium]|nr:Flp pilus assembly protein CpaB [Phycisphaerae bacterium]
MKSKAIVPLAVGLIVGIFAVSRGLNYVKSVKGAARSVATVPVVMATTDIPQGIKVAETMFKVKQVAKDVAPARRFSKSEEILDRVTCMMVPKDMPIMPTMLAPVGTAPGLGAKIPDGMRAVAVKVDEWSAVGGWLKPGVHVDVAAVFSVKVENKTKTISKIILQNIEVAAVGATMGQNPQETGANVSRSVTLIVEPDDVAKLHLAVSKGKISLAMRNSLDDQNERVSAEDEDQLLGTGQDSAKKKQQMAAAVGGFFKQIFGGDEKSEPVQVAEAPQRCTVDLVHGSKQVRRVYASQSSMETVGTDGSDESMLQGRGAPYGRNQRGRSVATFRQGGDSDQDSGPVIVGE